MKFDTELLDYENISKNMRGFSPGALVDFSSSFFPVEPPLWGDGKSWAYLNLLLQREEKRFEKARKEIQESTPEYAIDLTEFLDIQY